MKKLLIVAALALASLFGSLGAANASGVCVHLNVNGSDVVNQCQELPAAPALP